MSMTDPIADFLTRIRNAHLAKHDRLDMPSSKMKLEICRILKEEGFIRNYRVLETQPAQTLRVLLRYDQEGQPAIRHVSRISKPGRRVYRGAEDVRPVRNGLGLTILSTSSGLVSDRTAREQRVGGEVVCELW